MHDSENFLIKSAKFFDLPIDALSDITKVEICGTTQAIIENHKGILEYSDIRLSLNLGKHILTITGKNLNIAAMNSDGLRVSGTIEGLQYETV